MSISLRERFLKVLNMSLDHEHTVVDLEADLLALGFNSISYVKLVVLAEEDFGIEFNDQDLDIRKFNNLEDVLRCIEHKLKETPAQGGRLS